MKKLDLNKYGVLEMNAKEMRENDGGWMLFGTEKTQGLAFVDKNGFGYEEFTTTYFCGIAVSTTRAYVYA